MKEKENKISLDNISNMNSNEKIETKKEIDKYSIYSVIEICQYETSQEEITEGLQNPINEFQRICNDFSINCQNNCNYIDYDEAFKYKLSTIMLWGSEDSIIKFFNDNNIKEAINYFGENKEKTGIYLCLNICEMIGYLVIWPGKLTYDYSTEDNPCDSLLLTLVNYGFCITSNSILCLGENEIQNFNING